MSTVNNSIRYDRYGIIIKCTCSCIGLSDCECKDGNCYACNRCYCYCGIKKLRKCEHGMFPHYIDDNGRLHCSDCHNRFCNCYTVKQIIEYWSEY